MAHTNKEDLGIMLSFSFEEPINNDLAYNVYKNYVKLINSSDNETIDYLWRLVKQDRPGILKLRMKFAERGFELTPSQCEQYMFILATSLVDSIEQKK